VSPSGKWCRAGRQKRRSSRTSKTSGALTEPFNRASGSIRGPQTACDQVKREWGSRGLNPGPTDYENVQTLFEGVRHGPFRAQDADIQTI
jgi:hypothetical protein